MSKKKISIVLCILLLVVINLISFKPRVRLFFPTTSNVNSPISGTKLSTDKNPDYVISDIKVDGKEFIHQKYVMNSNQASSSRMNGATGISISLNL